MIEMIPLQTAENLHWYVRLNNRESGPYSYLEIISMINNKDIEYESEIVYRGLGGWYKVSEFANFTPENIEKAFDTFDHDPDNMDEIHFRRSIRIPLSTETLVVANNYFFKAECMDLSTGGCLIKLARGKLKIDQKFIIHFYENPSLNLPAFNIHCEAVRALSAAKLHEGSAYYDLVGVQFENLKKSDKDKLKETIKNLVFNTKSDITINHILRRQSSLAS